MGTSHLNLKKVKWLSVSSKKGFNLLAGINRPVNPSQVTKLSDSISRKGIIRPVLITNTDIIDGIKKPYIIDGQHLYTACLKKGVDVPYLEIDITDMKDLVETIALLNASSKSWCLMDYITAWQHVNPDYKKLIKYFNQFDLEIGYVASILHYGLVMAGGNTSSKIIKQGIFKVINEEEAVKIMRYTSDVLELLPRTSRFENRSLVVSFVRLYKQWGNKYNHSEFLTYVKSNKNKFLLITQDQDEFNKLLQEGIR